MNIELNALQVKSLRDVLRVAESADSHHSENVVESIQIVRDFLPPETFDYMLTDGQEVLARRAMTVAEWQQEEEIAQRATDGTWSWERSDPPHDGECPKSYGGHPCTCPGR